MKTIDKQTVEECSAFLGELKYQLVHIDSIEMAISIIPDVFSRWKQSVFNIISTNRLN